MSLVPGRKIIAVDFDGTITTKDDRSGVFHIQPNCARVLERLYFAGVDLILWTCRGWDDGLEEAVAFLNEEGVYTFFYAVNDHTPETREHWGCTSPKAGADVYIDDKALGCVIDWYLIEKQLEEMGYLDATMDR